MEFPEFDQLLADECGADEHGMKWYSFVILKTGTNTTATEEEKDKYFRGHMDNIHRLKDEGKLIVAGPFSKNDRSYRGLFILNVKTVEEAKNLLKTDPAIAANIFDTEIIQWYGSAALAKYLPFHDMIQKSKI